MASTMYCNRLMLLFLLSSLGVVMVMAVRKVRVADLRETSGVSRVQRRDVMGTRMPRLGLGQDVGLERTDTLTSAQGTTKSKFRETYKDIRVFNTLLDVEEDQSGTGHILTAEVYTDFQHDLDGQMECLLGRAEAEQIAMGHFGVTEGNVERTALEEWIYIDDNNRAHAAIDVELVIVREGRVGVTRSHVFIDKCSQQILESFSRSSSFVTDEVDTKVIGLGGANLGNSRPARSSTTNQGQTDPRMTRPPEDACEIQQAGGNLKRPIQYGTPGFCLRLTKSLDGETCFLENEFVKGVDLESGSSPEEINKTEVLKFPCSEGYQDAINGGNSPMFDAFFLATKSVQMYEDLYGYRVLTDPVPYVKAHYGTNVFGAYWDGNVMMVGDGIDGVFYPMAVVDVVGHEVSHGVTDQCSNLVSKDQSGAINEAFADMAGELAEEYVFGSPDWLTGGDFMTMEGGALRYFDDPSMNGFSIKHMDEMTQHTGQHSSSGIYTHSFWQMAQVGGLGLSAAFECFLTANRLYWRETTDFEEGACGTVRGAYDAGYDMDVVADGFEAVGITLANCSNLSELVTAELTPDILQTDLRVSRLKNPLFRLAVPDSVNRVTVEVSGGVQAIISRSYKRSSTPLSSGLVSVSAEDVSGDLLYVRFTLPDDSDQSEIRGATASVAFD